MKSRTEIKAQYAKYTVADLRTEAKHYELTGLSSARKAELVEHVVDAVMIDLAYRGDRAEALAHEQSRGLAVPVSAPAAPKVEIHTGGELRRAPRIPRLDFVFNLSRLLDDPLRTPDADLVKRDGLDDRMQDFVFSTEGAKDLYQDMVRVINRQLMRGKDVVVLVLCRGGKHRSVAFGHNLAWQFEATATHHHIDLPIVQYAKTEASK